MEPSFTTRQNAAAAVLAKPLFFIAGTERSGTTWLQLVLDAHPHIACRGEGQFMNRLFPQMTDVFKRYRADIQGFNTGYFRDTPGFPVLTDADERFIKQTALATLLAKFDPDGTAQVLGEKTPGNIRALDRLVYLAPHCRLVFIVRDGRDVAVSLWHHGPKRDDNGQRAEDAMPAFVQRVAKTWAADVRRMQAFRAGGAGESCLIRYEDLHTDPVAALQPVFAFLGVADDAETCAKCADAAEFSRFASGRSRGEEDPGSQFRKGIVGDWRNYDPDAGLADAFRSHASDALVSMGYDLA